MPINAEARVVAVFTFVTALLFGAWGALDHLGSSAWARTLVGVAVLIGAIDSVGAVPYFIAYT